MMGIAFASSIALLILQQGIGQSVTRSDYLATWDLQFRELDSDGDGKATTPEIADRLSRDAQAQALQDNRQAFARLDRDGNGALSPDEFALLVAQPSRADPTDMLRRLDMDHDGTITLIEHRTVMLRAFDALDGDKDGVVTPQEAAAGQVAGGR